MAYAVEVTLSTGNKVSLNTQSQEVSVSITYQLEREDTDVLAVVQEKAGELVEAHALARKRVKESARLPAREVDQKEETSPLQADVQEKTQEREKRATPMQTQLIRSLGQQAGYSEDEMKKRIQEAFGGCDVPEDLSHSQAAALLVQLGQEERERFEQERTRLAVEKEVMQKLTP